MSRITGKNTKIEVVFRKYLWAKGVRGYRIHNKKISGKPDVYFPKKRIAIFIDGCFWHKCPKCYVKSKTNLKFWNKKIKKNVERDTKINKELKLKEIIVIRIWEHEVNKDLQKVYKKFKDIYEKRKDQKK